MFLLSQQRHLPQRQRGAFGLLAIGVLLLLVLSTALALDTGRLYLEQRHMQRVADMAALEAAGSVPLLSQATDAELNAAAAEAARRNGHNTTTAERKIGIKRGDIDEVDAEGGGKLRHFRPESDSSDERNAIEVTASHEVRPSLFANLWGADNVTIAATAIAHRPLVEEAYAVFSVGSRLLSVNTDDSILAPLTRGLLGLGVDASLAGFEGIANSTIKLGELLDISGLTVGSVEELLSADLTLLQLVDAVVGVAGDDVVGLSAISNLINAHIPDLPLSLGALLDISTDNVPLMAELSIPELLSTALLVANQGNAVDLPGLNLDVPGVANIKTMLSVIEPPQIAIGPVGCKNGQPPCNGEWKTEARTAQVRLGVGADVRIPVIADLGVKLGLVASGARAGIEDTRPAGDEESHKWDVDVAAYQYPLVTKLDLKLGLLDSHLPWLDEDEPSSRVNEITSFLQGTLGVVASIVNGLVNVLATVVGGLLDLLIGGILGTGSEISNDGTEVCWKVLHIPAGCKPTDTLKDDLETDGGETPTWEDELDFWMQGFESGTARTPMTPDSYRLEWAGPMDTPPFTGSLNSTVTGLSNNLQHDINLRVNLFGVPLSISKLLAPILNIVDTVVVIVVSNLAGTVVDPLLEALGVSINEAEVRVIDINQRTGPPELL